MGKACFLVRSTSTARWPKEIQTKQCRKSHTANDRALMDAYDDDDDDDDESDLFVNLRSLETHRYDKDASADLKIPERLPRLYCSNLDTEVFDRNGVFKLPTSAHRPT